MDPALLVNPAYPLFKHGDPITIDSNIRGTINGCSGIFLYYENTFERIVMVKIDGFNPGHFRLNDWEIKPRKTAKTK